MEHIQLAQMLADLKAMEASRQEKEASLSLVSANKSNANTTNSDGAKAASGSQNEHRPPSQIPRSVGNNAPGSTSPSLQPFPAARLDALGRRLPASRTHSASNSLPGTPRNEAHDDEIDRARNIMALSDIRAKIREQDQTSLLRAREKMNALAARQQQQRPRPQAHRAHSASATFVFPKDK